MTNPVQQDQFIQFMNSIGLPDLKQDAVAVAVSGGADSLALAHLLNGWGEFKELHILSVDHGLRAESVDEVKLVRKFAKKIGAKFKSFKWLGDKPERSIQEAARVARYDLMEHYCASKKIGYLFLAHHGDDQVETFLFRLAKGSGLDGLGAMKPLQSYNDRLQLVRPLLAVGHDNLIATCERAGIEWAEDPSNNSVKYMRGRMRGSRDALENEGLTIKRVGQIATRLDRARSFIDQYTEKKEEIIVSIKETNRIEIILSELRTEHSEVIIRIIRNSIRRLVPHTPYPPRLEDMERLADRIARPDFRGATLGGVKFVVRKRDDLLELLLEKF
ncbi:MAG: tRNA lysidine(34) synthetase TilS [Alphaproteobacteria bacterium CG1_02_46_17]|nr:MAG: tRNA lysidine(34) synthetase TilS [Alphaproteobacteria bacterium CG1_02_46_17]